MKIIWVKNKKKYRLESRFFLGFMFFWYFVRKCRGRVGVGRGVFFLGK